MSHDVAKFISVVGLHFPPPKQNNETEHAAWCASMVRYLGRYPGDVLAEAAERFIAERSPKKDGRYFPVPSECIDLCDEIKRDRAAKATPLLGSARKEIPYADRCDLARALMKSSSGKQAIKEGWGQSMFHFCVERQRVPTGTEAEECKRSARQFAAAYERCLRGEHPQGGPLARLAESMVVKARELMGEKA